MATKSKRSNSRSSPSGQITTDHEEVRQWAESRGGRPACVRGTGGRGDTGLLRIDFPGYSGAQSLQEISWDEFFEKFEDQNLALLYQETTSGGEESRFNKLVRRTGNGASGRGNRGSSSSNRGRSGSSGRSAAAKRGASSRSSKTSSGKSTARARGRSSERGGKEIEMECVMTPVSRSSGRAMKGKSGGSRGGKKSSGAAGRTRATLRGSRASGKSRGSSR